MPDNEKTVAFFGSSLVSAYWNGAATYYRGILKALHALGFKITFYEPEAFDRQSHRDIPDPDYARIVIYPARDKTGPQRALEAARGADIIVKASGVGVFDRFLEEEVLKQRNGSLVIFWDVDAPATLDRVRKDPRDAFRALIPEYDLILTYGGGPPVIEAYMALGARRCVPVYNALDPDTHFPVDSEKRFTGGLGFLGNRMPDREDRVREFFFRPAAQLPEVRFLLGGNGWHPGTTATSNVVFLGHVYTWDHNAFNCTPLAILNINRESMARTGYSPPTRVFEAAGAGACVITDSWPGLGQFLEPGTECLAARDGAGVAAHVAGLTRDRAREIGRAARARVLREHTYERRAVQVDALFREALA